MRIVFFGTPDFAVPSLRRLIARGEKVAAVVCQPDKPAGRGQKLVLPPVKLVAEEHNLPVLQPERLRAPEAVAALRALSPELVVVAAYGKILPADVLSLPPRGCVNVHASLLPRYRGAAPIQWSILRGDTRTGITIMQMDAGMDTGDILLQRETEIGADETYGELQDRLAQLGAEALSQALDAMVRGELTAHPQDDAGAVAAPKIEKEAGRIDWSRPAREIALQVRAFNPWPSAYTTVAGQLLKIHRASIRAVPGPTTPGLVLLDKTLLVVACGEDALVLADVQPAGKQRMEGGAYRRGARLSPGDRLG